MKRSILLACVLLIPCVAAIALDSGSTESVSIENKKFSPANVSIKAGDSVVWTNNDDHDHTVVADDGSFKSDKLGHGESFKKTFKKAGTFSYSCTYHPRMKGRVTVE